MGMREEAKDSHGWRAPYLVGPFRGKIPKKPTEKDKCVQLCDCAVWTGANQGEAEKEKEERALASTRWGYSRERDPWTAEQLPASQSTMWAALLNPCKVDS